jgi:hypothetical protein
MTLIVMLEDSKALEKHSSLTQVNSLTYPTLLVIQFFLGPFDWITKRVDCIPIPIPIPRDGYWYRYQSKNPYRYRYWYRWKIAIFRLKNQHQYLYQYQYRYQYSVEVLVSIPNLKIHTGIGIGIGRKFGIDSSLPEKEKCWRFVICKTVFTGIQKSIDELTKAMWFFSWLK